MPRSETTIPTPDGRCPATLHTPDGAGPWPAVILFQDVAGVRESLRVMADRLAGLGYVTLVADQYYREGGFEPFDMATVFSDPPERRRLMELAGTQTDDRVVSDAAAFLDFLAARPEVSGSVVGTTGYCMGGRTSLIAAGTFPDRVAAAASFHAGRIAVEDDPSSPHLLADRMRATVYVGGAEDDHTFTAEQAELLEKALTEAGVPHTVETYPVGHGFAVPDTTTFDEAAYERHWEALEKLYAGTLGR